MTFLIAVLTGIGVGSGGLYILWLTFIKNIPQAEAQGMNLAFFITAAFAAAAVNIFRKRISFVPLVFLLLWGIPGAIAGCKIASLIDAKALSVMFGIFLIVVGISGLIKMFKR